MPGLKPALSEAVINIMVYMVTTEYVVIDNIAAVRRMNDLSWLEETFRDLKVLPAESLIFDIASKGLIPIREVNQKLQKLMRVNP